MPNGILRNEHDQSIRPISEFDRKQVLKNTEVNAQLGAEGQKIREQLREHRYQPGQGTEDATEPVTKKKFPKTKAPAALKSEPAAVEFDEEEIEDWDKYRGQSQKILEPNTPYMGTAADTEYYDEDPVPDDLDLGGSAA